MLNLLNMKAVFLLKNEHFHIIHAHKQRFPSKLDIHNLAPYFAYLTDRNHDLQCCKWACI